MQGEYEDSMIERILFGSLKTLHDVKDGIFSPGHIFLEKALQERRYGDRGKDQGKIKELLQGLVVWAKN